MTGFDALLVALVAALPASAGGPAEGAEVSVTHVDLDLPLEARLGSSGLEASLPRGRLRTGFDPPLGRLAARFALDAASS